MHRFDGELIHFAAQYGRTPEEIEAVRQAFPQRPSRASATARCILSAAVVQIVELRGQGYVVVFVDYVGRRGLPNCSRPPAVQ